MINENQSFREITKTFPGFLSSTDWEQHCKFWGNDAPGYGNIISTFSDYAISNIKSENISEVKKIFNFVEDMLINGDQTVQNLFATIFLENILDNTPRETPPESYLPLLVKKSLEYCRAWDEFTGVRTKGLWEIEISPSNGIDTKKDSCE